MCSGSFSGIPENLGLRYDPFMAMGAGCTGYGGTGDITGCCCGCFGCCCWLSCPGGHAGALSWSIIVSSFYVSTFN